jgi:hypothetical protein
MTPRDESGEATVLLQAIAPKSARSTAPGQTLAYAPTARSPIS